MSQPNAIAAVAATLRNVLASEVTPDPDLNDTTVTTQPPDRARAQGSTANQLNVFLYQALPNAAWRNMDMPGRVGPGETAMPPLPLTLHFLITAYGRDDDILQPFSLQLIGRAVSVLHDHAVLLSDEIKQALPDNDLFAQVEHVRLTLQPLSTEEIYRLWSGFQTPYRTSVAYEASVVLIDSTRRVKAALPVLTRGREDAGISAQGGLVPAFPEITAVTPPNRHPVARLGDTITIAGHHLSGDVELLFKHRRLPDPIRVVPLTAGPADELQILIDNDPAKWLAGLYTVSGRIRQDTGTPAERMRFTNDVSLTIAPAITSAFPIAAVRVSGTATVTLTCRPQIRPEQQVALLLGDREVPALPVAAATGSAKFIIKKVQPGAYPVRLRVDGVDSQIVDRSTVPPTFKDERVVIT